MGSRTIECQTEVSESAGVVYDYLTNGEKLQSWFPTTASSDPRVGGKYHFEFKSPDGKMDHRRTGSFTTLEAGRAVGYDWDFGQGPTQVRFQLEESGGQTRVSVSHTGFRDGPEAEQEYQNHDKGWEMFLSNLKSVIETGKDLRPQFFGG